MLTNKGRYKMFISFLSIHMEIRFNQIIILEFKTFKLPLALVNQSSQCLWKHQWLKIIFLKICLLKKDNRNSSYRHNPFAICRLIASFRCNSSHSLLSHIFHFLRFCVQKIYQSYRLIGSNKLHMLIRFLAWMSHRNML